MRKQVKSFVKKAFKDYCTTMYKVYKPCYDSGINPFI